MFEFLINLFQDAHTGLFELMVQPCLRWLGLMAYSETAFNGVELFLLGCLEIGVVYLCIRPLEYLRPAEPFENPTERRVDVLYTLLHRLGGFSLLVFAIVSPALDFAESELRLLGINRVQMDDIPLMAQSPFLLFVVYLVILDFADYVIHRLQHRWTWWWQLHALHHANTSMSLWSDNRNHLLDDLLRNIVLGVLSWFIGVQPEQFVLWVAITRVIESLQHANIAMGFGPVMGKLIVSPRFHRTHHAISSGNEGAALGCNFGVIFPVWDILFGTATYSMQIEPTGVKDALAGRQYGTGFWQQQKMGVLRLLGKA